MKKSLVRNLSILSLSFAIISTVKGQTEYKRVRITNPIIVNERMPDSVSNYAFKDSLGRNVRLSDFKGKYVMIDVWYSGCGACIHCNEGMRVVHERMKNKNIVFLSISIDNSREIWIQGITKGAKRTDLNNWAGMYWPAPGTVALFTGANDLARFSNTGSKNPFINKYNPSGFYPVLLLIDPTGVVISNSPPRPDFKPEKLVEYINKYL